MHSMCPSTSSKTFLYISPKKLPKVYLNQIFTRNPFLGLLWSLVYDSTSFWCDFKSGQTTAHLHHQDTDVPLIHWWCYIGRTNASITTTILSLNQVFTRYPFLGLFFRWCTTAHRFWRNFRVKQTTAHFHHQ